MADCIFCRIVAKEMKADVVSETAACVAFRDINPQAPVHILVIPRKHIPTLNDLKEEDGALVGNMFLLATEMARKEKIDRSGYRTVFNTNRDANQTVFHIHLHVLGGRGMSWPPG